MASPIAAELVAKPASGRSAAPYAASIFASATLLFLVQPIIAKELLPAFGGGAAVWTACMMFFQTVLLFGYLYAHWSIRRLGNSAQCAVHLLLLALSSAALWVARGTQPHEAALNHPGYRVIAVLAGNIGLPFFLLSSTTPLLQSWYSRTGRGTLSYRFYALSNLGSLLALLAYPFAIEPLLDVHRQIAIWRAGYLLFACICAVAAIRASRSQAARPAAGPAAGAGPNIRQRATWVALAACSCTLLLAVTNKLGQEIAPVPLLWIAPLAIYLLSFTLSFDHDGFFRPGFYRAAVPPALIALAWLANNEQAGARIALPAGLGALFIVCMFCHGQLAQLKPGRSGQTSFYLCISFGGALGGVFVGLIAPAIFRSFFEMQVAVCLGLVLSLRFLFGYRAAAFLAICGGVALLSLHAITLRQPVTFQGRNFYGVVIVREKSDAKLGPLRTLIHGGTIHGAQALKDDRAKRVARFYYGPESGVALALRRSAGPQRVGVVGLGTGAVAVYGRRGDSYRFYEINPLVEMLARTRFSYLGDSAAAVEVVPGDGRLSLAAAPDQNFDTLVLDAFSGDSIPVHLLTVEAFQCYSRHVKPDGVMAVHISNRYLNLAPVVTELARVLGRKALRVLSPPHHEAGISAADWVLVAGDDVARQLAQTKGVELLHSAARRPWTDQFSNILGVLK